MADPNNDTQIPDNLDPEKVAAANQDTSRQQADQDLNHVPAGTIEDTREALRKLREEQVKAKGQAPPDAAPVITAKADDAAPPADPAKPSDPPADPDPAPPKPGIFDDVQLSSKASPKSSEAFATIKLRASQEIAAREKAIDELKAEIAKRDELAQAGPPDEVTKELEELRAFRAKLDIEADPEWNKFETQVKSTQDFVYAQLRKSPEVTDAIIADIKKFGGPENVNLEKLFEKINDPTLQRIVESKIGDIEMAKFNREQALKSAKENVTQYVDGQRKKFEQNASAHHQATQKELKSLTSTFKWLAPQTAPAGATDEVRKNVEAHNSVVQGISKEVDAALKNDTPEMRAVLIGGMANFLYWQHVQAGKEIKYAALEKKLAEVTAQLEKVKGASINRLHQSSASAGAVANVPKPATEADLLNDRTGDALNRLKQQMGAARAGQ